MSRVVPIPGGAATLREPADLRVRHRRLIETASIAASDVIARLPSLLQKELSKDATAEEKAAFVAEMTAKMADIHLSQPEADLLLGLQDATILACLESWTLKEPLPKTLADVGDMDPAVYDALANASKEAGASIAATSFEPSPDKQSPTGASSDFAGSLRDETAKSTPQSLTDGAPTSGGGSSPA